LVVIAGNIIDGNLKLVDLKLTDVCVVDFVLFGPFDILIKLDYLPDFLINEFLCY